MINDIIHLDVDISICLDIAKSQTKFQTSRNLFSKSVVLSKMVILTKAALCISVFFVSFGMQIVLKIRNGQEIFLCLPYFPAIVPLSVLGLSHHPERNAFASPNEE